MDEEPEMEDELNWDGLFDDDDHWPCWKCHGDGWVAGEDIADSYDYGWIDHDGIYPCNCCHGSGKAEDCTYW